MDQLGEKPRLGEAVTQSPPVVDGFEPGRCVCQATALRLATSRKNAALIFGVRFCELQRSTADGASINGTVVSMFSAGPILIPGFPLRPNRLHRRPVRQHRVMSNLMELGGRQAKAWRGKVGMSRDCHPPLSCSADDDNQETSSTED